MKSVTLAILPLMEAAAVSPLEKTIEMLNDLESKIIKEGEDSQKQYTQFSDWCEDRSKNIGFEIKTATANVEELQATIAKENANSLELQTKIEDLGGGIASDQADLKDATQIREKEAADFSAEEAELTQTMDMLQRAITVLEKEMAGGASMMQLKSATSLQQALDVMVKASAFSSADASRLTALVQTVGNDEEDEEMGPPDGAVYDSHSAGIVDTLNGILEKAEQQLNAARGAEINAKNNYDQLKQSLTDSITYGEKDKDAATKNLAASGQAKAMAEGDLTVTQKDLAEDTKTLSSLHQDCMVKASSFEAEVTSRGEELKALGSAKKAITDMSQGAGSISYSFVQMNVDRVSSRADLANLEAVRVVRDLARKQRSPALAQLASRMATAMRLSSGAGEDPFAKIKGMVQDMINKLEQEAAEALQLHEWCTKELAESHAKKDDVSAEKEKLTAKLDEAKANSAKLKEEVATLQQELADLARTSAEMDNLRAEEKATFEKVHPELEMGLKGVKLALKILNDYYARSANHETQSGAASGIIGMLEVVESDFSKNLAQVSAEEEAAVETYERETKENEITKTTKQQDVKYKTKEYTSLDKTIQTLTTDIEGVQSELDAVYEYLDSLNKKCTYKVETYAERSANRDAEIAGLKSALEVLNNELGFIQKTTSLRSLRGVQRHA